MALPAIGDDGLAAAPEHSGEKAVDPLAAGGRKFIRQRHEKRPARRIRPKAGLPRGLLRPESTSPGGEASSRRGAAASGRRAARSTPSGTPRTIPAPTKAHCPSGSPSTIPATPERSGHCAGEGWNRAVAESSKRARRRKAGGGKRGVYEMALPPLKSILLPRRLGLKCFPPPGEGKMGFMGIMGRKTPKFPKPLESHNSHASHSSHNSHNFPASARAVARRRLTASGRGGQWRFCGPRAPGNALSRAGRAGRQGPNPRFWKGMNFLWAL